MSRKLFAFLLSELKTVRVICKHAGCGVVTELPVGKLNVKFANASCPLCGTRIGPPTTNPFLMLAAAIEQFGQWNAAVDIEFVVPDEPAGS